MKIFALTLLLVIFIAPGIAKGAKTAEPLFLYTPWHKSPGGNRQGVLKAETPSGHEAQYLVLGKKTINDIAWVSLRLPGRPNNARGWVPARRLEISRVRSKLYLSTEKRQLSFFWGKKKLWSTLVVVGAPGTPTPTGNFALWDRYRDEEDMYPWVFPITAHSEVLDTFGGGEARVALHGRHGALMAPWGSASSNGCIRTPDWALRFIRKHAPLGTPFQVR